MYFESFPCKHGSKSPCAMALRWGTWWGHPPSHFSHPHLCLIRLLLSAFLLPARGHSLLCHLPQGVFLHSRSACSWYFSVYNFLAFWSFAVHILVFKLNFRFCFSIPLHLWKYLEGCCVDCRLRAKRTRSTALCMCMHGVGGQEGNCSR